MWINDTFRCSLIILSALLGLVAIHKFVAADAPDPYLGRAVKRCQNSSDMRFMTIGIVGTRDRNDPYNTLLERAELMLLRDRFGTVYHLTEFDYGSNGTGVAQTACYVLMFVEFRVVPEKRSSYFSETDLLWYERNQVDRVDFLVGSYVASAASISALKNIPYFVITPVDDLQTEHLRLTGQIAGPIVNMQPFREQTWLTTADLLRFLQSERVLLLHDIHYIVDVERVKTLILLEPGWLVENIYPLMIRGTKLAYYQGEVGYTIGADPDSIDDIVYLLRSRDIDTVVFFFHRTYRWAMITDLADIVDQTGVKSYKWICGTLEGPSDEGTVAFPPSQTLLKLNDLYIDVPSSFKKNTNKTKDDPGSSRPGRVTADTEVDMYLLQFSHLMRRVLSGMRTGFDGSRFHASVLSNKYNASRLLFPTCNHYLDPIRLTFDSRGIRKQPKIAIAKVFASETKVNTYWQNTTLWEHRFVVDTGCPVYSPLFHFKIVPLIEAPYLTVIEDPLEVLQGNDRFDGLLIDLLRTIEEYLLSDYDIRLNVDIDSSSIETTGGGKVANGTGWTGAIGRLVRSGDYLPMILGALTKTLDRMQVVQFTPGFIFDGITVIYRPVRKENSFYSFLKPFDYGAWIVVLAAILLSLVHLRFLYFWDPMKDAQADTERNFRLKAVSWYSFGTTFQSGAPYEPISTPMRIYAVTLMFFASRSKSPSKS
ncbi:glutamate receptor ionotropic, NMDA 2B-like [Tubulanus polymorphus]|uniref:glutamate receptor ionotropic, NMDA 2B-like n=1 Tax=Tubulanus polymorphus TaxID=672921 RepID=UPI003DA6BE3B